MITNRFLSIRSIVAVGLAVATCGSASSQPPSPRSVLVKFCEIDTQGELLSPNGWHKAAALFLTPGEPKRDKVIVIRDYVVSHSAVENDEAELYVEYVQLGQIDPSRAHFSYLPAVKVRSAFSLKKQAAPGSGEAGDRPTMASQWRIAGPIPAPHVTLDAAIRYALQLRSNAKDTVIRKNAERMIATLKRLHE